jgi:pseudaminic acid synthase
MTRDIDIQGKKIGPTHKPFIVAEMSGNHNQSLERALELAKLAAKSGVHGLKLQTYRADTITLNASHGPFFIEDKNSLWEGNSLYSLYEKAYTPWEWHKPIFDLCAQLNLICFSTPFDESAVDFLEELNVPCYKIASFENIHIPLIRKVASTGKPVIISTGMATEEELSKTVQAARKAGCKDLILLKCTSQYPASPYDANLLTIPDLRERFGVQVGLSDHTTGIGVAVASIALGVTIIEKHFTSRRSDGGVDSAFSMEPEEMAQLVIETTRAQQALGHVQYGPTEAEKPSLQFRRSLYVAQDMKAGELFTPNNMKAVRPGGGLPPEHYEEVLGKPISRDAKLGDPVTWDLVTN